jgi:hypothetical protein
MRRAGVGHRHSLLFLALIGFLYLNHLQFMNSASSPRTIRSLRQPCVNEFEQQDKFRGETPPEEKTRAAKSASSRLLLLDRFANSINPKATQRVEKRRRHEVLTSTNDTSDSSNVIVPRRHTRCRRHAGFLREGLHEP